MAVPRLHRWVHAVAVVNMCAVLMLSTMTGMHISLHAYITGAKLWRMVWFTFNQGASELEDRTAVCPVL